MTLQLRNKRNKTKEKEILLRHLIMKMPLMKERMKSYMKMKKTKRESQQNQLNSNT